MHIVIVGLGYAGLYVTAALRKYSSLPDFRLTVISEKDYFYHVVASPRAFVDDRVERLLVHSLENLFDGCRPGTCQFIVARVMAIHEHHLMMQKQDQEERFDFDIAVLCLGSTYAEPCKPPNHVRSHVQVRDYVQNIKDSIQSAKSVLIVGGGAAGIEYAGDIKTTFPEKQVILLHAHETLLTPNKGMLNSLPRKLESSLRNLGVELILGERLVSSTNHSQFTGQTVLTNTGRQITTDVQLFCIGARPNVQPILNGTLTGAIQEEHGLKRIHVTRTFQLQHYSHIFAAGDCCDADYGGMAYFAELQSSCVAHNIGQLLKNSTSLKEYQPASFIQIVSVGKWRGAAQLPGGFLVVGDCLTPWIKRFTAMTDLHIRPLLQN